MPINAAFIKGTSGVINFNKYDVSKGGHAVLVVGYSDTKQALKIVNSWGYDWGQNGFAYISYQYLYNVQWFEAWALNHKR